MSKFQKRRDFIKTTAAAGAVVISAPYIKGCSSAGKLSLGLWDHWVPGANDVTREICESWGRDNGVEVTVDFITSIGNKLLLTAQAESRAKNGHDIYSLVLWMPSMFRHRLLPVDDLIEIIKEKHGEFSTSAKFLAYLDGNWRGVPAPTGSMSDPMVSRIDFFKDHAGVDLQTLFPASRNREKKLIDAWTYEAFLEAAKKLHLAGKFFGAAIAATPDSNRWTGALFAAYGAELVNESGDIVVDSDQVREVLEYLSRLTQYMPDSIYAWDDASNNRWLISGEGSCIFNPPSAWAVAKRDNPKVASQLWHHDAPKGPKGRFRTDNSFFWGIWDFSENISAAKDLLLHVTEQENTHRMTQASQGFDIPGIISHYQTSNIWAEAEPPSGVLYNYPIRGDEIQVAGGYPAPPEIASQIFSQGIIPNLIARVTSKGESFDEAIKWAENELEGVVMRG